MSEENRKMIRWYFRIQIFILSVALVYMGVMMAAERTEFVAEGTSVSAKMDKPVDARTNKVHLSADFVRDVKDYAGILPFPIGNIISIVHTAQDMMYSGAGQRLNNMHNDNF